MDIKTVMVVDTLESFQKLMRSTMWRVTSSDSWRCDCPELVELYEAFMQLSYFHADKPELIRQTVEWILQETKQNFLIGL